jgi:hypothetical protein
MPRGHRALQEDLTMRHFVPIAALLPLAAFSAAALAQPAQTAAGAMADDVKINQLIVYGEDKCPVSAGDEITVCARRPESDRYRIPEPLRDDPDAPANEAWTKRAEALEYVGRTGIGSCTPVGPGGGIGCYQQLVRQARAEREGGDDVNWQRLVEEARQERLSRIDAEAKSVQDQIDQNSRP